MRIRSQRSFWSAWMFIAAGIAFAIGSTAYPMGTPARPGAGYFPLILSVLLVLLGVVVLVQSLTAATGDGEPIGGIAWRPLIATVASIAAFAVALPRLGLFVAIPLSVVVVSLASRDFAWKGVVATAIVLTAASWAIFVAGLHLQIPLLPPNVGR